MKSAILKEPFVALVKLACVWFFERRRENGGRQQIQKSVGHTRAVRFIILICNGRKEMSITEKWDKGMKTSVLF